KVLVLGLARSGQAASAALERRGLEVIGADRELGNDTDLSLLDGAGLLVKSPGVPREAPLVAEAERRGIPIWSEVELGYRLLGAKILGVTGTNGKTTTSELLGVMLVAFGLVMVYSATSASAARANGDPAYFLKRQAGYALLGLVLMVVVSRIDYRILRGLAPILVVTSIALLLGVLVLGQAVNGARRWVQVGPAAFQPSELPKLALAVWAARYLTRLRPPHTLEQLWRPLGLLTTVFCVLLLAE